MLTFPKRITAGNSLGLTKYRDKVIRNTILNKPMDLKPTLAGTFCTQRLKEVGNGRDVRRKPYSRGECQPSQSTEREREHGTVERNPAERRVNITAVTVEVQESMDNRRDIKRMKETRGSFRLSD